MAKRLFDLVIAASALALLWPLLLVLAVIVRLDSPGAALFRQTRVGLRGRPFHILKFRSMRADAPTTGPSLTVGADARITRAGAWMRAHHLDELPQLVNVIAGDMSMVGPRPELPRYVERVAPDLRERWLAQRPGITDPTSLAFADEAQRLARAPDAERAYVDDILPAKVRASIAYAERATLVSDAAVLLRSLVRVVSRR